jgi:hypothetical protein
MSRSTPHLFAAVAFAILSCLLLLQPAHVLAGERIDGDWELNLTKSKYDPGPPAKSASRTYRTDGDMQTVTIKIVMADGETISDQVSYRLDGKDYPVKGSTEVDAVAWTMVDDSTARGVTKRDGKIVTQFQREVSADGKTLTLTVKGKTRDGRPMSNMLVFDRK